jgi:L-fuculose-phosphate aldolase
MDESLTQALTKLACASRVLELEGHGDMSLGHLALRDPEGR